MNQYEASVVICCSNYSQKAERLKYLEECMVGLSVQTNLHSEVILVSHKNIDLVDSVRKKFAMTFPVSCVQTFTENLPIKRNMGITNNAQLGRTNVSKPKRTAVTTTSDFFPSLLQSKALQTIQTTKAVARTSEA